MSNAKLRATMLKVFVAVGLMLCGCGMTTPWLELAAIHARSIARWSWSCSWAGAANAASCRETTRGRIDLMFMSRRAPCGARLHLHDDVAPIQKPEDAEPEPHEAEAPQERCELRREKRLERQLIARLLQSDELAADVHLDQRGDEPRHDARSHESHQRIDAVDHERLGPA